MSERRRWSLRRRLVVGTSLLVAIVFAIVGVTTVLALRENLTSRLDEQVLTAVDMSSRPGPGDQMPDDGGFGPRQRIGTLQVVLESGDVVSSAYTSDTGAEIALTDEQLDILQSLDFEERTPVTVDLGGNLGSFRLASETVGTETVIAGNSLDEVTITTGNLALIITAVMAAALLLAVLATTFFVKNALRPLERVASTATRVAQRPLAAGAVTMPERVPAADTDPDTEVGQVGAALNQLLGHVESALCSRQHSEEQLRRFIADASHELRTPLASIRGYAELSQSDPTPMSPTQERSLERIAAESIRMTSLVEDLLLLARLDAGQPLRREPVDLARVVVDGVSDAHATDPSHHWTMDLADAEVEVTGDENRLRQVVVNLLGNARVHTPPGTNVTTELSTEADAAVIRVLDDGPGIAPELQAQLFQRFTRGDSARSHDHGSTGLGLSITQAIVEAHDGTVAVQSEPGRTVFTVRVPLRRARGRTAA
ncbi:sensor histidine kinase [Herbiconiux sp. SYSU D00978]|uniref:sensor histidine kinase n=1 Tax=Herbiconiux sp. SYSU D00978 TaxID=2812562 RepID=UPI001A95993E|nr:ATP-binding protein [Herbiconiux sp. SYSU D00978]